MRRCQLLIILSLLTVGCERSQELSDADGDGFTEDVDCNDQDSAVNPDASEICDGIDNDCDGGIDDADDSVDSSTVTVFYADGDLEGFGTDIAMDACRQPQGY